ncbi:hypothetical protein HY636_02625 [Candidatus Woesearchaeota archaeon]|nr:hypothetical protein [Candidatus Woesearchaeota archaeon]
MGFFDKLKFWKKSDEFGDIGKGLSLEDQNLGGLSGTDLGLGRDTAGLGRDTLGLQTEGMDNAWTQPQTAQPSRGYQQYPQQSTQQFQQPAQQFHQAQYEKPVIVSQDEGFGSKAYSMEKNMEVISAKLDALKAGIDAMNQRLATIEHEIRQKKW